MSKGAYMTLLAGIMLALLLISFSSGSVAVILFQALVSYSLFNDVRNRLNGRN